MMQLKKLQDAGDIEGYNRLRRRPITLWSVALISLFDIVITIMMVLLAKSPLNLWIISSLVLSTISILAALKTMAVSYWVNMATLVAKIIWIVAAVIFIPIPLGFNEVASLIFFALFTHALYRELRLRKS